MTVDPTEPARRVTRVAAYAICVEDGRILLCRIAPGVWEDVGGWTLPGGGLDHGESPTAGALRELEEETGLRGAIVELLHVRDESARWIHPTDGVDEAFHSVQIIYRVRVTGGELRAEVSGSTDAARWFTKAQAAGLPLVELARAGVPVAFGD